MSSAKELRLVRLFAACVLGRWDEVTRLRLDAPAGEPDREWRETVLQTHIFAGFPRTVEAYGVLASAGGLGVLEPDERDGASDFGERGARLFERIYAERATEVRATLASGHPDFAEWIERHAYGRVLARPGLSPAQRELLAVVALAALGQDRQLASHARGAVRCGATAAEVAGVLECVRDLVTAERYERARDVIEHFSRA